MKRFLLIILALMSAVSLLPANPVLTAKEETAIETLLETRVAASCLTCNDAVACLSTYRTNHLTAADTAGFSDEAKLILDALVDLDILTYYQVENSKDPRIQQVAEKQYLALQGWMDAHPSETPNKWTYCLAAEAFDWYLAYLPMTQILSKGLLPKQYYQKALEQDPDMAYAHCGLGQWMYYAPVVGGGGGTKNAKAELEKAVKAAKTAPDAFITHLFYSQILYETKDKAGARRELDEAETAYNGSHRLQRFRQMNDAGFSWFEFARDFENNKAKLGAPLVN